MRTKYASIFLAALVLGWSAPDLGESGFGVSAEARPKFHAHKKAGSKHHRIVRKMRPSKAVSKHPVLHPRPTLIAQASLPSSSPKLDLPLPPLPVPATPVFPPDLRPLTRDQQMEKLRVGLERLAKTIAAPDNYMERLRLGLERRAQAMNAGGI